MGAGTEGGTADMADGAETFRALHRAADADCGARLFTITVFDRGAGLTRRAYTSHPVEYPVSGTKPMRSDAWTRQVIDGQRSFVANTTAEFASYFADHAQINALGCASAMNIPVADGTEVVGTVNILDVEDHFDPARVAALEALIGERREEIAAAMEAARRTIDAGRGR